MGGRPNELEPRTPAKSTVLLLAALMKNLGARWAKPSEGFLGGGGSARL